MNEDEIIRNILGPSYANVAFRVPFIIPQVYKASGFSITKVARIYLVKHAIEIDPENSKLKELKLLLNG